MLPLARTSFDSFGLSGPLLQDLARAGFVEPTPIQARALPPGLAGHDVLGCAETGTGKTAAFVIPIVERLADGPTGSPRGLILAPTRELAFQIQETVDQLGRSRRVLATTLVGGSDMQAQVRGLRQHPEVVVATPGRLLDHLWQGTVNLTEVRIVVLDEADRMLDMGFAAQLTQIIDALPPERQSLLFSATLPTNLRELAHLSLTNPVSAMVSKPATPATGVKQTVLRTSQQEKTSLLLSLLTEPDETVLVFTGTKHRADRVGEALQRAGHRVAVLHGDLGLPQRRRALEGFRRRRHRILVATDIAARGLDVADIGHVINYDLPHNPEDYVHRIGRTARMKAVGRATSLVTVEDSFKIRQIEKLLGQPIPRNPTSAPSFRERRTRKRSRSRRR